MEFCSLAEATQLLSASCQTVRMEILPQHQARPALNAPQHGINTHQVPLALNTPYKQTPGRRALNTPHVAYEYTPGWRALNASHTPHKHRYTGKVM